jgi:two-component system response regulator QseB
MRILLTEDNFIVGKSIKQILENKKYLVDWVQDGESCETALRTTKFDIIILDINLPDISGIEIIKKIRGIKNYTPILVLSARNSIENKIEGLDLGADDYLTKPFDYEELLARIKSLHRRNKGIAENILTFKNIELDINKHIVRFQKKIIEISPKEFTILKILLENIDRPISKSQLEEAIYTWDNSIESNAIEVFIHNLRKKIPIELIKTVRGVGYTISNN